MYTFSVNSIETHNAAKVAAIRKECAAFVESSMKERMGGLIPDAAIQIGINIGVATLDQILPVIEQQANAAGQVATDQDVAEFMKEFRRSFEEQMEARLVEVGL